MSWADDFSDKLIDWSTPRLIIALFIGVPILIGWLIYSCYQDSKSPDLVLKKAEWACAKKSSIETISYVLSGKVMVPITTHTTQCVNWVRK